MHALTISDLRVMEDEIEPRMLDTRLAERWGYAKRLDIRELIQRHLDSLGRLSRIFRTVRKNEGPGRPGTEYWLTEAQALFLTAKSEAECADECLCELIEIYLAYKRGYLVPKQETPALEAIRKIVREEIERSKSGKGGPSKASKAMLLAVIRERYHGYSPVTHVRILDDDGNPLRNYQVEHMFGPNKHGIRFLWVGDDKYNLKLETDPRLREAAKPHFQAFQDHLTAMFGDNPSMREARKITYYGTRKSKQRVYNPTNAVSDFFH